MSLPEPDSLRRILVIDDNRSIHEDFRKILLPPVSKAVDDAEAALFGVAAPVAAGADYHIDSAYQGKEGLERVEESVRQFRPYAMAFVDVRMPPGWDGIDTVEKIWKVDPEVEMVVCTAHSDHTWEDIIGRLGLTDRLLILKKPFDNIEVKQLAHALTQRWITRRHAARTVRLLEELLAEKAKAPVR